MKVAWRHALAGLVFMLLCMSVVTSKMSEAELFDILGLPRGAGGAEVKKAYRELALRYIHALNLGVMLCASKFYLLLCMHALMKQLPRILRDLLA
jgi:hypothetical protein